MTADAIDFWFPGSIDRFANDAQEREAWTRASVDATRTLCRLDGEGQLHSIELSVIERSSSPSPSLSDLCANILSSLQRASDATGTASYAMRWLVQVHATRRPGDDGIGVRLRVQTGSGAEIQVAGTLLADLRPDVVNEASPWLRSLGTALEQHPLARAGAEYAIAIDLPLEPDLDGRETSIRSALKSIGQLATLLPEEPDQVSTLSELWLNASTRGSEPPQHVRLRVWRLGYMKVRDQKRIV